MLSSSFWLKKNMNKTYSVISEVNTVSWRKNVYRPETESNTDNKYNTVAWHFWVSLMFYLSWYGRRWNLCWGRCAETLSMCFVKQAQAFEIILSHFQSPLESSLKVTSLWFWSINQECQYLQNSQCLVKSITSTTKSLYSSAEVLTGVSMVFSTALNCLSTFDINRFRFRLFYLIALSRGHTASTLIVFILINKWAMHQSPEQLWAHHAYLIILFVTVERLH